MADRYKVISHEVRRKIIMMLRVEPLTAGQIVSRLKLPNSTASQHLSVLRHGSLVRTEKSGTEITYFLKESVIDELYNDLAWLLKGTTND